MKKFSNILMVFVYLLQTTAQAQPCRVLASGIFNAPVTNSRNWFECERDRLQREDGLKLAAALVQFQEVWLEGNRANIRTALDRLDENSKSWQLSHDDKCALVHALLRRATVATTAAESKSAVLNARQKSSNCQINTSIIPPETARTYESLSRTEIIETPLPPVMGAAMYLQNGDLVAQSRPGEGTVDELKIDFIGGNCRSPALTKEIPQILEVIYAPDCIYRYDRNRWTRIQAPPVDIMPSPAAEMPLPLAATGAKEAKPDSQMWKWIGLAALVSLAAVAVQNQRKPAEGRDVTPVHRDGF